MNTIGDRLIRSWELFKRSVQVITQNPRLLLFPIVTALLTSFIAFFFLAPVLAVLIVPHWVGSGTLQSIADSIGFIRLNEHSQLNAEVRPVGTVLLAGLYLLNMFLATMASVAFSHEILEALNGRPVSISRGIHAACVRWQSVLLWSLLAGVVGLIIRFIEERLQFVGRLIAGLLGLAWSIAAVFAIPVLVRDPELRNPFKILSRSANMIRTTWGEMLAGYVGMGGMNLVVVFGSIFFWVVLGAAAIVLRNGWLLLVLGLPWLLAVITYGYLASIASRVYLCALYLYASEGTVAPQYDASMMETGWKHKK